MTETVDLLVRPGWLFPLDGETESIRTGEVAVRNGLIVHAGPVRPGGWDAKEVVDAPGCALLPGFVNCHCHTASTIFRAQSEDGEGGRALYTVAFRGEGVVAPGDWARLASLGTAEMARAGITTLNDFWSPLSGSLSSWRRRCQHHHRRRRRGERNWHENGSSAPPPSMPNTKGSGSPGARCGSTSSRSSAF